MTDSLAVNAMIVSAIQVITGIGVLYVALTPGLPRRALRRFKRMIMWIDRRLPGQAS